MLAIRSIHKTIAHVWPPTAAAAAVGRPPPSFCVRPLAYRPSPHQLGGGQVVDPFGITKEESDGARAGAAEAAQANSPAHTTWWDEEVSQPARCSRKKPQQDLVQARARGGVRRAGRMLIAPRAARPQSIPQALGCVQCPVQSSQGGERLGRAQHKRGGGESNHPLLGRARVPFAAACHLSSCCRRRGRERDRFLSKPARRRQGLSNRRYRERS